ncbi:serine O-acetyltransferase [Jeongeupia chitinilytica]|uniref:Serine acetyltransferase n=1 Tax=Jeongeupia chitinilytica TaxID=1041641 RepID=A0ABQ3GWP3_9NEIS|nr:serine acetyltransferase [Jeongeupia chitinilytica]GHD56393.1 serine acetyltransferase [Jeongeupia chitinilytica]
MVNLLHRWSRWLWQKRVPLLPKLLKITNRVAFGVVLPPSAQVGNNVLFSYQGLGTVIHKHAVIEDDVVIATGVTIGGKSGNPTVPLIKQGAFIGTGAKILGPVVIGRYASVGANSVVLADVPDYAVVVGIPARVVRINRPDDLPDYRDFRG